MQIWAQLGLLLLVAAALTVVLVWLLPRVRRDPAEKERRRRLNVNLIGRLGDAVITEVEDNSVFYSYSVRGVAYTAAQDISRLRDFLPEQPERLIGPVTLKYAPGNPANSIIVCEDWSGLRPVVRTSAPRS
jgi:hypothetical protein